MEVGSGIGNLKAHLPGALATDLFPNPWLDLACDGYELPFRSGSLSHLVLFDVFHHLRAPNAFLREARRVLAPNGRLILFEPYISLASYPVYGLLHHEPVAWSQPIDSATSLPRPRDYYAAQGNATRLFFRKEIPAWPQGWVTVPRRGVQLLSLPALGRLQQTRVLPAQLAGNPAKTRRHTLQLAAGLWWTLLDWPAAAIGLKLCVSICCASSSTAELG